MHLDSTLPHTPDAWGRRNSWAQAGPTKFWAKKPKKNQGKVRFFFNQITERMPHLKYYKAAVFELELPDLDQI